MKDSSVPLLAVCIAVPALAQSNGTFVLTSSNTVTPTTAMTVVGVWAAWDDPGALFLFNGADYDLTAGEGAFSSPVSILNGPGSSTGVIAGNVVSGAINGQIHSPPFSSGSRDNPILLATYLWTTRDFTPRTVSLDTSNTTAFFVAWFAAGPGGVPPAGTFVSLFPQDFSPGSGVINVIPAPGAWLVLALPLAAATRRRRC